MQKRGPIRLFTPRYWRELWRLFALDDIPEHAGEIRREQSGILSNTVFLYTLLGVSSSTLFIFGLDNRPSTLLVIQWVFLIFLYVCLNINKHTWQKDQNDARFISRSLFLFVALGCTWGTIISRFALEDEFITDGVLLEISMGLVSTPIIGVPLSAAFAFFLPVSSFCILVIFTCLHTVEAVAKFSFVGFIGFAASGIIYINKILIERAISRLNLERQNETISVFLREYETNSPDWLWETDRNGRLRNVDVKMKRFFQPRSATIEGCCFADLGFENDDTTRPTIDALIRNNQPFRDHVVLTRQNGQKYYFNITGHPAHDRNGHFLGFRGVSSNITEKKKAESRVHFMANYDDLTKVMNRQAFLKTLHQYCENKTPFTFLLIDVDRFKLVNDQYGHEVGNVMLRMIVKRIKRACHPTDLIGRLGGDEFTLILPSADQDEAVAFSRSLVESFNQEFFIDHIAIRPSVSVGVAFYPRDGETTERLFHHADLALYHAKKHRNSFSLFKPAMEEEYFKKVKLKADLVTAIDNKEFFLEYQPIFDTTTAHIVSAEALIRWRHPEHGVLSAEKFIKTIEDNGLVDEIGAFTLNHACREAVKWPGHLPIAVNVSPSQLRSGNFVSVVATCLNDTGLPPSRLGLEVTETTFLAAEAHTLDQLRDLRKLGVRLILDDFGTGYSSLTYLCDFDVDGIKIDASFMENVTTNQKVTAIVRTIARLAADMNVYVVAEGIEHENQLIWLQLNGIPFAQGFYLSRPRPSEDIRKILTSGTSFQKMRAGHLQKPPPGTTRH